ncbi:hypothetical protein Mapa_000843 [Marchantia paleacea]|nr:hypothetical protein Mapa_000843 [Marchantia paleacea]
MFSGTEGKAWIQYDVHCHWILQQRGVTSENSLYKNEIHRNYIKGIEVCRPASLFFGFRRVVGMLRLDFITIKNCGQLGSQYLQSRVHTPASTSSFLSTT